MPTLDDDSHWTPIEVAHERLTKHPIGNASLAVIDLMKALTQGQLCSMKRSLSNGERRPVAPEEWRDQIQLRFWKGRLRIVSRRPIVRMRVRRIQSRYIRGNEACITRHPIHLQKQIDDRQFYVWQPHYDRIWPAKPPNNSSEAPSSQQPVWTPHRKVGRPFALTRKEIETGKTIIRRADREHRKWYPKQRLKIGSALDSLREKMKRNGKPIVVSDNIWKKYVIWPVLRPDKTNNN